MTVHVHSMWCVHSKRETFEVYASLYREQIIKHVETFITAITPAMFVPSSKLYLRVSEKSSRG